MKRYGLNWWMRFLVVIGFGLCGAICAMPETFDWTKDQPILAAAFVGLAIMVATE